MKKVLLIAMHFFNYDSAVMDYLVRAGYEVMVYDDTEIRYNLKEKIVNKLSGIYNRIFAVSEETKVPEREIRRRESEIHAIYMEYRPDIVISLVSRSLTPELLSKMKDSVNILWTMDSFQRFPNLISQMFAYDKVYVFEHSDVELLEKEGIEAEFLPLCADDRVYYPQKADKIIDILFVGNIYKKRKEVLNRVLKEFPQYNIEIYGYIIQRNEPIKKLLHKMGLINKEYHSLLTPEEVNDKYAQTKICLNIHHEQTIYGANMRVYESLASECFQLCDDNPYIRKEFSGGLAIYKNEEDLINQISYYLENENERNKIAKTGYSIVKKGHTFQNRMKVIMEFAENEYSSKCKNIEKNRKPSY